MNVPAVAENKSEIMEAVLIKGDLGKLTAEERNRYYLETCQSIGLNPLTKPFDYLVLNGRTVMYAKRDAADQLRKLYGVDIQIIKQEIQGDLYCVTVRATDKTGRSDEDVGITVLPKAGANDLKANMILKAITKAKRRVTLSICGLGFMDESEVEDLTAAPKRRAAMRTVTSANVPQLVEDKSESSAAPPPTKADPSPSPQPQDGSAAPIPSGFEEADGYLAGAATQGMTAMREAWNNLDKNEQRALASRKDFHKKVAELVDAREGEDA